MFERGAIEKINTNLNVCKQAELLPYNKMWEFPRENLDLERKIGTGEFGLIMKAKAYGICKGQFVTTVAVKMVRVNDDFTCIKALVSELKIMIHLGRHLNILNLLGACTTNVGKSK